MSITDVDINKFNDGPYNIIHSYNKTDGKWNVSCAVLFNRQRRFRFDFNVMLCVLFNTLYLTKMFSHAMMFYHCGCCYSCGRVFFWRFLWARLLLQRESIILYRIVYIYIHLNIYSIDYPEKVKPRVYLCFVLFLFTFFFSVISSKYRVIAASMF